MKRECIFESEEAGKEEEVIRKMASGWKRSVRKNFFWGIMAALCISLFLAGGYWGLTHWLLTEVPAESIQAEVERDTDGILRIRLEVTDGKNVRYSALEESDGEVHIILKRGLISTDNGGGANWTSIWDIPRMQKSGGREDKVKRIYIGEGEEQVLVWEE